MPTKTSTQLHSEILEPAMPGACMIYRPQTSYRSSLIVRWLVAVLRSRSLDVGTS